MKKHDVITKFWTQMIQKLSSCGKYNNNLNNHHVVSQSNDFFFRDIHFICELKDWKWYERNDKNHLTMWLWKHGTENSWIQKIENLQYHKISSLPKQQLTTIYKKWISKILGWKFLIMQVHKKAVSGNISTLVEIFQAWFFAIPYFYLSTREVWPGLHHANGSIHAMDNFKLIKFWKRFIFHLQVIWVRKFYHYGL